MIHLVGLSVAGVDLPHAQMLRALLVSTVGNLVYLYSLDRYVGDVYDASESEFSSSGLICAVIGPGYDKSRYCKWEEIILIDRIKKDPTMVVIALIEGASLSDTLQTIVSKHSGVEVAHVPADATSWKALLAFRALSVRIFSRWPELPKHPREEPPAKGSCPRPVERHVPIHEGLFQSALDDSETLQTERDVALTSALFLGHLDQTIRGASLCRGLQYLADLSPTDLDQQKCSPQRLGSAFLALHNTAIEQVLYPIASDKERDACGDVAFRFETRCMLLLRFEAYVQRHLGRRFQRLPLLMDTLGDIVLPDAPPRDPNWLINAQVGLPEHARTLAAELGKHFFPPERELTKHFVSRKDDDRKPLHKLDDSARIALFNTLHRERFVRKPTVQ